jgi:predicted Zn-dependent protease with MMP-like domain
VSGARPQVKPGACGNGADAALDRGFRGARGARARFAAAPLQAEFPDAETEAAMGLDSPFDLLGLYRGVALPLKSVSDPRPDIDMIFLYRRPILDYWCDTGDDLFEVVRHVLIHEIGHHFGFSDADMERIENSA